MIKINEIYIEIHSGTEHYKYEEKFSEKVNFFTTFHNTKGKSSLGQSILFCLGLEEISRRKNEESLKPVLKSNITIKGENKIITQSDIFLEIRNSNNEIITIQRSPNHNSRDVKLISVYFDSLKNVKSQDIVPKEFYVHDKYAAQKKYGFHKFLEDFIGLSLPDVASYSGKPVKLYLQTLASCSYIEQKEGWSSILATIPTKFRIKNVRERVTEFNLGLSVTELKKEYDLKKKKLDETVAEWKLIIESINSLINEFPNLKIKKIETKPFLISNSQRNPFIIIASNKPNKEFNIDNHLNNLEKEIAQLSDIINPKIMNISNSLKKELKALDKLIYKFKNQKDELLARYYSEKEQLKVLQIRSKDIILELDENKTLLKLKNMGGDISKSINSSTCPTCGNDIDSTVFNQNHKLNIMSIEDTITQLESEKTLLKFSAKAQEGVVEKLDNNILRYDERIEKIMNRIRDIKSDLTDSKYSLSKSHINKLIYYKIEKSKYSALNKKILNYKQRLIKVGLIWSKRKADLDLIPDDFLSYEDLKIIKKFEIDLKSMLHDFKYDSTNPSRIKINNDTYLPQINNYDVHADSSASDTIRIIWAYIIALKKRAIKANRSFGFLVLDEPAQQNTDLDSVIELFKKLEALSEDEQIFIFYNINDDTIINRMKNEDFNFNFNRIHLDEYIIK